MKLLKILYGLYILYSNCVLSQNVRCNGGEYYCNDLSRCITKGVVCKSECNICLGNQKRGQNFACINACNNQVDHLTNICPMGYYDHDNNPITPCITTPDCLEYTKCNGKYEVIKIENICSCQMKEPCDRKYVCPYSKEIKSDMLEGYTTYEVSLVLNDKFPHGNIYAIYGDINYPMVIPAAFQIDNIGVNIGGTNPLINKNIPEGEYDSWLTIGVHNSNIGGKVSAIGIDFSGWDEHNGITVTDGAVFLIDPTVQLSKTNKYIIGQLTLQNDEDHTLNINVQGMTDITDPTIPSTYVEKNIVYFFKRKENIINQNGH
jgi:hypothetical protein